MKKNGILNSEISKVLSDLGHTDQIVICDCGLPIPEDVKKIDLALEKGNPRFEAVLDTVLKDMEVEKVILANEIKSENEGLEKELIRTFDQLNCEMSYISHKEFKEQTKQAKAIIRTGEVTPYANIILQSGVIF